jgi:hypothetical protein
VREGESAGMHHHVAYKQRIETRRQQQDADSALFVGVASVLSGTRLVLTVTPTLPLHLPVCPGALVSWAGTACLLSSAHACAVPSSLAVPLSIKTIGIPSNSTGTLSVIAQKSPARMRMAMPACLKTVELSCLNLVANCTDTVNVDVR